MVTREAHDSCHHTVTARTQEAHGTKKLSDQKKDHKLVVDRVVLVQ